MPHPHQTLFAHPVVLGWRLTRRLGTCSSGIRHAEELSLSKPLEPQHLKHNLKDKKIRNGHTPVPADTNTFIANSSPAGSNGSLDKPFLCAPVTPTRSHTSTPISSPLGTVSFVSLCLPPGSAMQAPYLLLIN